MPAPGFSQTRKLHHLKSFIFDIAVYCNEPMPNSNLDWALHWVSLL